MSSTNDSPPGAERYLATARVLVVGQGRMGTAIAAALRSRGVEVGAPEGRGGRGEHAEVVLLAVPDAEIAAAAAAIAPGRLVGHLSGATGLEVLKPHEAFSLHPLTTVAAPEHDFAGGYAAVDATTDPALAVATELAETLGMRAFRVRGADRAAYHAAASIAANFLITIEGVAEQLARTAGVNREALVPLVRAAVENWAERGAAEALTGPIARGDEQTVARQRSAVSERLPEYVPLFDELAAATRRLADSRRTGGNE